LSLGLSLQPARLLELGSVPTLDQALQQARQAGVDRLDAQLLLAHLLQQNRTWLLAHGEAVLTAAQTTTWHIHLQRRAAGEPLAYVLGEQPFCGLLLKLTPDVLIPRPETEGLVLWAQSCVMAWQAEQPTTQARVVDLGTGSGAIALALVFALRHHQPNVQVTATDNSPAALAVAQANAQRLGLPLHTQAGPWWQAVPGQRFAVAVSNPPYIAEGDPHLAALTHEPQQALTAGHHGLADLQQIVAGAPAHLLPGAWLLLEHGHDQAPAVQALLLAHGFEAPQTRPDLAGLPRCTGARWPSH
jgi:release factor glutamine methyltransferase